MTHLPKTIKLESMTPIECEVTELGCTEFPSNPICDTSDRKWDLRRKKEKIVPLLKSWTFPERVEQIRQATEQALEEGIEDQKRVMRRNLDWGDLDPSYVVDIAMGDIPEAPFCRWSRVSRDTCSVAIVFDGNIVWRHTDEEMAARMALAAGLGSALEALDFEVQIVTAAVVCGGPQRGGGPGRYKPRQEGAKKRSLVASVLKAPNESLTCSAMASVSATDIPRTVMAWRMDSNFFGTPLTDGEWRQLVGDVDFFIHFRGERINTLGTHNEAKVGLVGPDVLSATVRSYAQIDEATKKVCDFFHGEQDWDGDEDHDEYQKEFDRAKLPS